MTESFDVSELVGLFRDALVALLPIMDKSRIEWRDGRTYDPWEEIERTLYHSIIGSCVDNVEPSGSIARLAAYGLERSSYADRSFLVASDDKHAAFLELAANREPFSEAVFLKLGTDLAPSGERIRRTVSGTQFLLAAPKDKSRLEFHQRITYLK
jgi:hypothetical protein